MKMKPEHFAYMRAVIGAYDSAQARAEYRAKGLSLKRYQWDITYTAGLTRFICESLYPYLNDDHIQTALNRIVPTLDPIVSAAQKSGALVFAHVGD